MPTVNSGGFNNQNLFSVEFVMARKLKDLDINFIALVEDGAVRKRFYLKKEKEMEKFIELLKGLFGEEGLTEDDIAKAKELSDESVEAITGALNAITVYSDSFPPEFLKAQLTLLKHASCGRVVEKAELTDEEFAKHLIENIEKVGASLSKATRAQIERIRDICAKMLETRSEKKKGDDEKENLSTETLDKLDELERLKKAEADRVKKEASEKNEEDIKKLIKDTVEESLKPLLKEKGITKKIKDQEKEEVEKEGIEDPFPSIQLFGSKKE